MKTVITAQDKLAAGLSVLMFGCSPENNLARMSAMLKELPEFWKKQTKMQLLIISCGVLIECIVIGAGVGIAIWEWDVSEVLTSSDIVIASAVGFAASVAFLTAFGLTLLSCKFVYALGAYCVRFIGIRGNYNLGMQYCKEWDLLEGTKWLRHAASQGHLNAYFALGCLYADGKSEMLYDGKPAKKRQTDIVLKIMMAPLGDATDEAIFKESLQKLSFRTADFPTDYKEAAKWWLIAAKRGHAEAQFRLGRLYLKGEEGVPQDDKEAYIWLFLAALNDSKFGVVGKWGRDEAAANLSPEIRAAQAEAENRFERLAKIRLGMMPPALAKFIRRHHIDKLRRKLRSP